MTAPNWIELVHQRVALTYAAQLLGYSARGNQIIGCPVCHERGNGSSRIRRRAGQPEKWRCYRCDARGDAVDFVAHVHLGHAASGREDWERLQAWFAGVVSEVPYPSTTPAPERRPPRRPPPPPPAAPDVGLRPDASQLASVWKDSGAVDQDESVAEYLRHRRMDPAALAALDLARALPAATTYPWPEWWPHRTGDHRLAVLLYESDGQLATLQARSIDPDCPKAQRQKWPRCGPGSASGVFFADAGGLRLLRGEPPPAPLEGLIIVEGLTDFLRVAMVVAQGGLALAVLGATSGNFGVLAEAHLPAVLPIYACADDNDTKGAGELYAAQTARAFGGDRVYRVHPSEVLAEHKAGADMDDALAEDGLAHLRQLLQSARRRGPVRGAWECADPEVGMAELTQAAGRASEAETPEERRRPIVSLLRDPEAMRGLGAAWRTRQSEVTASLLELRDLPGLSAHLSNLQRQIQVCADDLTDQEAAARRSKLRLAEDDEAPPEVAEVLAELVSGEYSLPRSLTVPAGWRLAPDGIYERRTDRDGQHTEIRRLHQPVVVTGRLTDVDTGATHLRLEWPRKGRWQAAVISQADATNARSVQELANQQAPIHSGNAGTAVRWISEFEIENDRTLPQATTSGRMGWHGSRGFLWGSQHLRMGGAGRIMLGSVHELAPSQWDADHLHLQVRGKDAALARGYHARGDFQSWAQGLGEVLAPYPVVWIALYAALAAPLLKGLQSAPPFVVSLEGDPGGGKSTALAVAASVWGCPLEDTAGPMVSWDNSPTRIEEIAGLLQHMPLLLDDTKKCGEDAALISRVIYMIVGQQGKGRSNNFGGEGQERAFWKTILISTGEAPLTAFSQSGGTRARVLPLRGRPFGDDPEQGGRDAEAALAIVAEHYGHAGPRIIQWLLDNEEAGAEVRFKYAEFRRQFEERAAYDNTARRASRYLAVLKLGWWLMHHPNILRVSFPEVDPIETVAWPAVEMAAVEADRAKVALSLTWSWATAHTSHFWGRHETDHGGAPRPPASGWLGVWKADHEWDRLALEPSALERFLRDQGFKSPVEILSAWRSRGWLVVREGKPGLKYPMTTPGGRAECYVLRREALQTLEAE